MRFSERVAHIVTERRGWLWLGLVAVIATCLTILVTRISLDSDVLNMLPGKFDSVQGLKIYNRDFEQTRELTFALQCAPNDVDKLEEFAPVFAGTLRKQPWCERVLAGSPMETPDGVRDLQAMAIPLLLNLEPSAFDSTMSILHPENIRERLHRLRGEIEAGSPRAQFQLEFDPLGVIGPALKPFAENNAIEAEQPLTSPDRTMRVFLAVTNRNVAGAFECQRLMREVNAFRAHATDGWTGGPLQLFVTGRAAYVAEISLSMRYDIVATLLGSILLVGGIFFAGFRRWIPLFGMGLALLLSCLVALALGLLIFGRLNMVTVGFSSILVGLGVDFAILIFGRYQQARIDGEDFQDAVGTAVAKLGRAVFFGALTTAVGFLALVLSGSSGFSQLGVLIAIGIMFAGFFMCTILFLFLPKQQAPLKHDWIFELVKRYVCAAVQRPRPILTMSILSLSILTLFGFSPRPPVPFDSSTRALEPKNSNAARALNAIMSNMPTRWEPVLGIVRGSDPKGLHNSWQKISAHWSQLQRDGKIKGFTTPLALLQSPQWMQANREQLRAMDFAQTRDALTHVIDEEGFNRDSFASAFKSLAALQSVVDLAQPLPNWRDKLPKSSSWWFLVDRYFAQDPLLTTGFVTTNAPVKSHADYEMLSRTLQPNDTAITLSGWSYTLANLLPWAQHQLLMISLLMALFDAALLAILYRDWRLWLIQEITLLFGVGAMLATMKICNVPLTLLNVLAFRLVLAIGVDYGIYIILVWQKARDIEHDIAGVVKPVLLAGLTAVSGFGSLGLAKNPSLSGLGIACAIGIFWSLVATIFFTLPAIAAAKPRTWRE